MYRCCVGSTKHIIQLTRSNQRDWTDMCHACGASWWSGQSITSVFHHHSFFSKLVKFHNYQTAQITVFSCTAHGVDYTVNGLFQTNTRLVSPECITVTIVDDTIADPGESFRVQVSTSNADRVSFSNGVSEATINIINDDGNFDT